MIEVTVTEEQVTKAKAQAKDMGLLNNSITKGEGSIAGFIGELVVASYLEAKQENTYDYDLVLKDGRTVDVKTKRTKVKPRKHYETSVAAFNTKQKCDCYYFVRVSNDLKTAWLLGMVPKEEYFKKSKLLKKGQQDGDNGFIVKADCYNMSIEDVVKYNNKDYPD